MKDQFIIIDFDSTFIKVEALEELAKIVLAGNKNREKIMEHIVLITKAGMEGKILFSQSLASRIKLLNIKKYHLNKWKEKIRSSISDSIKYHKRFFFENRNKIYIISGAFKECILPVVRDFGILEKNVFANTFVKKRNGGGLAVDMSNPLSCDDGKIHVVRSLKLKGQVVVVGDGFTDYKIKQAGLAHRFFAYCENVRRENVIEKADYVVENFDEFLRIIDIHASEV